jgi:hypothetical protein
MLDPTQSLSTKPVRVWFRPYSHQAVQDLVKAVSIEFGRPGKRWKYRSPQVGIDENEPNAWSLDFYFANPHDAVLFSLKYQK